MNEYLIGHFLYKKGRVGRELFEFEELWFSFSRSHFFSPTQVLVSHPGERASRFGRNVTFETRNMSTHLTLSGGRGKPAVAETFNRTWQFFPRQVAEEKGRWLLHNQSCRMSELFHWCCCMIFLSEIFDLIGERKRFSDGKFGAIDSATWFVIFVRAALYDTDYSLYICDLNNPKFIECFTTSVRVLETSP